MNANISVLFLCFTVLYFLSLSSNAEVLQFSKSGTLPPVVFIPGDGGNVIESRVNLKSFINTDCPSHRDWFQVWLNLKELLPNNLPCQVEIMKLYFNNQTNSSFSQAGVDIRIPGFGNTHTVEYIDDSWEAHLLGNVGAYAHELVEALVKNGLVRNVSIRGAPYDFRLSMGSQKSYFDKLKALVEDTYTLNGNSKVALISHSLGCLYATWFLNHQSQAWKDKFVDCSITLSSPWGGSSESLQAVLSGFTFHFSVIINPLVVRQEQRTWESNFLLLPNAKVWPNVTDFVLTDERNFTATRQDMSSLLRQIGVPTDIYEYVRDANDPRSNVILPQPGVPAFCVYGTEVPTNHVLDYRGKKFPDDQPEMVQVSGDGTVSQQSLSLCRKWGLKSGFVQEIPGASHMDVLRESEGIDAVLKILKSRS